jgi:cell division protein FtsQ
MKKRAVVAIILLILFSTITAKKKTYVSQFNLKEIKIENNFILGEKDIKDLLIPFYEKNLFFINYSDIEKALLQNSFIQSFKIKKVYPQTLKIKVFEKKPIAIVFYKKRNFYLSEKIELIELTERHKFKDLPYVIGNHKEFKNLYVALKEFNFPFNSVKKFILYESNRWDIEMKDNKIIKLPSEEYKKGLKNFLNIKDKNEFKKYKIFDFRVSNQLIVK